MAAMSAVAWNAPLLALLAVHAYVVPDDTQLELLAQHEPNEVELSQVFDEWKEQNWNASNSSNFSLPNNMWNLSKKERCIACERLEEIKLAEKNARVINHVPEDFPVPGQYKNNSIKKTRDSPGLDKLAGEDFLPKLPPDFKDEPVTHNKKAHDNVATGQTAYKFDEAKGQFEVDELPEPTPEPQEISIPKPAGGEGYNSDWLYNFSSAWHLVKPEYAACGVGQSQSPIDIRPNGLLLGNGNSYPSCWLDKLEFEYKRQPGLLMNEGHTFKLQPKIPVDVEPSKESKSAMSPLNDEDPDDEAFVGSKIKFNLVDYELRHVEFHAPSENTIEGEQFPMEVQMVHSGSDGSKLVVAYFLDNYDDKPCECFNMSTKCINRTKAADEDGDGGFDPQATNVPEPTPTPIIPRQNGEICYLKEPQTDPRNASNSSSSRLAHEMWSSINFLPSDIMDRYVENGMFDIKRGGAEVPIDHTQGDLIIRHELGEHINISLWKDGKMMRKGRVFDDLLPNIGARLPYARPKTQITGQEAGKIFVRTMEKIDCLDCGVAETANNQRITPIWDELEKARLYSAKRMDDFDFEMLLPDFNNGTYEYYFYWGSYSTPPCKENIAWVVLKNRHYISEEQLERFINVLAPKQVPNNRPVQPMNRRKVVTHVPDAIYNEYCHDKATQYNMCNQQWNKKGLHTPGKTIESVTAQSVTEVCRYWESQQIATSASPSPSPSGSPSPQPKVSPPVGFPIGSPSPSGFASPSPSGSPEPTPIATSASPSPVMVEEVRGPPDLTYNRHDMKRGDKGYGWQPLKKGLYVDGYPCNEGGCGDSIDEQASAALQPENAWLPYEEVFRGSEGPRTYDIY